METQPVKVCVINLDADIERFRRIAQALSPIKGIDVTRVPGVKGKDLPLLAREVITSHKGWARERGQIGCFLAHLNAWEIVAAEPGKFCVIFEDDARPIGFERILKLYIPVDADLIFINSRMSFSDEDNDPDAHVFCMPFSVAMEKMNTKKMIGGLDGYILTPAGAKKLIAAVARDFCYGNVDGRVVRYSITEERLDAEFSDTWISEIVKTHHNKDRPPSWGVITSYCVNTPLVGMTFLPSTILAANQD